MRNSRCAGALHPHPIYKQAMLASTWHLALLPGCKMHSATKQEQKNCIWLGLVELLDRKKRS